MSVNFNRVCKLVAFKYRHVLFQIEKVLQPKIDGWEKKMDNFMTKIKKLQKDRKGKKGKKGNYEADDYGERAVVAGVSMEEMCKVLNTLMNKQLKFIKNVVLKVSFRPI